MTNEETIQELVQQMKGYVPPSKEEQQFYEAKAAAYRVLVDKAISIVYGDNDGKAN